ncbi:MAG: methyltransferase domain-containing protein [Rhodobacteraceae bacterium]|nr:methyltransferase domain-containing protein [Paracoccaceae bacterium]
MTEKFLKQAYSLETPEATKDHYDRWAASYDAEIAENGYATPGRIAEALWQHCPEPTTPVLDFGCGTGLSGLALRRVGFQTVDGMDPSAEMLDGARSKEAYRNLTCIALDDPTPIPTGAYRLITGTGVLGVGAAPPEVFDMIMNALPKGGLFAFSYNDHALADAAYTGKLSEWVDCGAARLLFKEYGEHLPGLDLKADVYVIEKA